MESGERSFSPADALGAVRDTRAAIAGQRMRPRWYEVIVALVVAVEALVQLIPVGIWHFVAFAAPVVLFLAFDLVVRSRVPYLASAWGSWPLRGIGLLMILVIDALFLLGGTLVHVGGGGRWLWIPIAAVVFGLTLGLLRLADRVWAAGLRSRR